MGNHLLLRVLFAVTLLTATSGCGPGGTTPMPDSGFRVEFGEFNVPRRIKVGEKVLADITVKNTSNATWPSRPNYENLYAVNLAYHWINKKGIFTVFDGIRTPLPGDLPPRNSVKLKATIQAPDRRGRYILEITLVQEGHAWFPEKGGEKLTIPVRVVKAG